MKNKIVLLGSIIFVSNVVLGETLVALPQPSAIVSQLPIPFEQHIVSELVSRGLEVQAAKKFSQNCVVDSHRATLLTHMLGAKLSITQEEIHQYIASQSLFNKSVDLRAHSDIVVLVQNIKGFENQKEDLEAIQAYIELV